MTGYDLGQWVEGGLLDALIANRSLFRSSHAACFLMEEKGGTDGLSGDIERLQLCCEVELCVSSSHCDAVTTPNSPGTEGHRSAMI